MVSILFLCWGAGQSAAGESAVNGWHLKQYCPVLGDQDLYVTATNIRLDLKKQNAVMLCSTADWKLILYCPRTQLYFETADSNARKLLSQRVSLIIGLNANALHFKAAGKGQISGANATKLVPEHPARHGPTTRELWTADQIQIPARLANAFCNYEGITPIGKIPLKVVDIDQEDLKSDYLVTSQCRRVELPASVFALPKSYKRVSRDMQIMIDDGEVRGLLGLENAFEGK